MAWIRWHQGAPLDAAGVRECCRVRIAHFKVPRYRRFVEEFPMTVTGKPQKCRMREPAAAQRDGRAGQV